MGLIAIVKRRWIAVGGGALERLRRDQSGQALVESAIVMPLMVFFILAIIQLAMVQHARIMTEYAAFNAARSGIVWNADRFIMENAAIMSLLPTNEGLVKEGDAGNPLQLLKRIAQRALLYQINRRLSQAVGIITGQADALINAAMSKLPQGSITTGAGEFLKSGVDELGSVARQVAEQGVASALGKALGNGDDRMVRVDILNPSLGITSGLAGGLANGLGNAVLGGGGISGHFSGAKDEIDFDDPAQRLGSRLTIRLRYMYVMRIPFANWIIHGAWLAGQAGRQLYGAIWNPQTVAGETGFRSIAPYQPEAASAKALAAIEQRDLDTASKLAQNGVYALPLYASYTMRMQSNPYRSSVQQ